MWNENKKLISTVIVFLLFLVAACVYMSPALQGHVIATSDGVQGRAAVQESVAYAEATGDCTWWTGSMFSGMPNYQVGGGHYMADTWLTPIKKVLLRGHSNVIAIVLLYLVCFFALLRSLRLETWLAMAGAFAITFSSYFFIIIGANHHSKTSSIALMAAVVAGFCFIFRGHKKTGACLTLLGTAAGFYPHPQMSYYMCFLLLACWVAELCMAFRTSWKPFVMSTLLFAACFGIGIGTGTAATFANLEYAEETMRGGASDLKETPEASASRGLDLDYATAWSYGVKECWTFLIPNALGGSSNYPLTAESDLCKDMVKMGVPRRSATEFCHNAPLYWGDQPFTAGPVYMGAVVCLLFVLGLFLVEGAYRYCLLALTLLSIALSLGHHFMGLTEWFFRFVPLYNKFRAVSSILILAEITMPMLGFLALKKIYEKKAEAALGWNVDLAPIGRKVWIATGITLVLLALAFFSLNGFTGASDAQLFAQIPSQIADAIKAQREALCHADILRSAVFVALTGGLLWAYCQPKWKSTPLFAFSLLALILLDMWPVNKRYMNDSMFSEPRSFAHSFDVLPWEKQILDHDNDPDFRVFNLTQSPFNDARTSYRMKSIGGYSAAKLRRYQDLIDEHLSKMHLPVLNMLNTKYFIVPAEGGTTSVEFNPEAMGNAWFVDTLHVVNTPREECDGLMQYDLHTTAVVDKTQRPETTALSTPHDSSAVITLTHYTPNHLTYTASCQTPKTAVFSEIFYPHGWKATMDDKPADPYRVNYMLRALDLPAGTHQIDFVFDPDSVRRGNVLSMCFVLAMYAILIVCAGAGLQQYYKKKHA